MRTQKKKSATSKPPYSFSLLIYMAIEHSPNKCLPVKEIYSWILDRFPYFATAPTGWKNSVRHNLSLNKCFQKVERSHGKVNGKGSLWCVDPEYKPNLMQALKKQPFSSALTFYTPPASPQSGSLSPHFLSSVLKQNQVRTLKESDIDAATAMMLLNTSIEQGILECEKPLPLKTAMQKKRSYDNAFSHPSTMRLQESDSLATIPIISKVYVFVFEVTVACIVPPWFLMILTIPSMRSYRAHQVRGWCYPNYMLPEISHSRKADYDSLKCGKEKL
ncbi:forkhead box protein N2-like [Suricata suricatta]|uniref:forkhead box protein N2-like n=1 Tax=Suricata suricatta TaxID=37032 RepID=UPI001155F442|nr:forkhead box protein N2-like [Suricata suricatta]